MNIWHYIHPHYRYDIQEMKIVLAKQLLFFILSRNYRVVSHSKFKEVLYQSISQWVWCSFRGTVTKKSKYFTPCVLELKADRQSHQKWGHRMPTYSLKWQKYKMGNRKRRWSQKLFSYIKLMKDMLLFWEMILHAAYIKKDGTCS